jgi:hypothetical protein
MISDNDPNALWLDPRFETNPAFLADEAEGLLEKDSNIHDEKHFGDIHVASIDAVSHSSVTVNESSASLK